MRIEIFVFSLLYVNYAFALKGLKQTRSLRLLQDGPPVAGAPKEDPADKGITTKVDPKNGTVGPDGAMSKDPKEKKCKKAKMAPLPKATPNERLLIKEAETADMEVEYCLHGEVTESECQAAKAGQVPKGHRRIQADVEIDVSYKVDSKPQNLVNDVEQVFKSETASEFIGCDNRRRRRVHEAMSNSTIKHGEEKSPMDLQVTGVDFNKLKAMGKGDCVASSDDSICETLSSNVEIYYQGEPITSADQMEMFALLIATIEAQAIDGDFAQVGTIENIALTSEISNSTGNGGGLNIAKTAGIPAGVVGAFLIVVGGITIGYCMMRGKNDNEPNDSNNANPDTRDVVEAEAIAIIDDEEEDGKKWKWKKNPSKFL